MEPPLSRTEHLYTQVLLKNAFFQGAGEKKGAMSRQQTEQMKDIIVIMGLQPLSWSLPPSVWRDTCVTGDRM